MGGYNDYTKNYTLIDNSLKVITRKDETGAIVIEKIIHPMNNRNKNKDYNEEIQKKT